MGESGEQGQDKGKWGGSQGADRSEIFINHMSL